MKEDVKSNAVDSWGNLFKEGVRKESVFSDKRKLIMNVKKDDEEDDATLNF